MMSNKAINQKEVIKRIVQCFFIIVFFSYHKITRKSKELSFSKSYNEIYKPSQIPDSQHVAKCKKNMVLQTTFTNASNFVIRCKTDICPHPPHFHIKNGLKGV